MSSEPVQPKVPERRGVMLVVSSPSGAGKTTLSRRLLSETDGLEMSVSSTTREKRPGEVEGVHYQFVTHADFESGIEAHQFLEWAKVFDNYYGTPRGRVEDWLRQGVDVVFDVDWQGARALKQVLPGDVVSVFILPPSIAELKRRLEGRPGANPEGVARRLEGAAQDIQRWGEYDHIIVNEDIDRAYDELRAILLTERLKRRFPSLGARVDQLLSDASDFTSNS